MALKGQLTVGVAITAIIMVVTGVIGLVFVNDLMADAGNYESAVQEAHTMVDYSTITLDNDDINPATASVIITNAWGNYTLVNNGTADGDYNISSAASGLIGIQDSYDNASNSNNLLITYEYEDSEFFDSSLSRTMSTYLVPIGMLGLFGLAAGMFLTRRT